MRECTVISTLVSPTPFISFHPCISSYKNMKMSQNESAFSMEADEEDDEEIGDLCAEILENWNSPTCISDHNPFSVEHHQPLSTTHDVQTAAGKRDSTCLESDISMSKLKHNDRTQNSELEHKDTRKEPSIIPVLVADTFFDKMLQRYVDGVDIAALSKVGEANAHGNEAESSTVSANNGKRMQKLGSGPVSSLFKPNVPTMNMMPKRSPISGEHRHMQVTSTEAPVNYFRRSFVARYVLPPRKTIFDIDIDEFRDKMWRNPGANISDFFNFGLDEKQWKDYCKLMQGQKRVRSFRRKEEDESTHSLKIAMHNSSYENDLRRQHIKDNGVLTADRGAILRPYQRNTPYMNCRMINGDKISPFPRNSYSDEDGEWKEEQSQQYYDAHFTKLSTERKGDLLISHSEVEKTGTDETGKKQSSRTQEHSLSQRSPKSARFEKGNQTSYHNVNLYLAESLCSPRVESVREKREYYVSHGVPKEYANRTFPTNIHNSGTNMTVEEDTEKLKRRKERFDSSLPILKNVVADTSMEIETTNFKHRV